MLTEAQLKTKGKINKKLEKINQLQEQIDKLRAKCKHLFVEDCALRGMYKIKPKTCSICGFLVPGELLGSELILRYPPQEFADGIPLQKYNIDIFKQTNPPKFLDD